MTTAQSAILSEGFSVPYMDNPVAIVDDDDEDDDDVGSSIVI